METSATRRLKLYAAGCLATLAAIALLSTRRSLSDQRWLPAPAAGPPAVARGRAGLPHAAATDRGHGQGGSSGPDLTAAAADWGSETMLENPNADPVPATAAPGPGAAVVADTAVPPAEERLFGPPLPRLLLYGGYEAYEPIAYRRYSTGSLVWPSGRAV